MAREYAPVKVAIWADDDFRRLTVPAQHLYFLLMTAPSLSHAGVADFRPNRISALANGWDIDQVIDAAEELEDSLYVVIDRHTEEILIRSFIRHDGLMKQPKMAVSMANAHAGIASAGIRGVIVHELRRLYEECPDLKGWASESATALLKRDAVDPSTYPLRDGSPGGSPDGSPSGSANGSASGFVNPKRTPNPKGSGKGSPAPAPAPAPTTSNQEPSANATPDATRRSGASQVVVEWAATCKAAGVSPISDQSSIVGRLARELLEQGNELPLVIEAACLAAEKGKPWIADFVGPAVAARQKKPTRHDDKGNPTNVPAPPRDPFADEIAALDEAGEPA